MLLCCVKCWQISGPRPSGPDLDPELPLPIRSPGFFCPEFAGWLVLSSVGAGLPANAMSNSPLHSRVTAPTRACAQSPKRVQPRSGVGAGLPANTVVAATVNGGWRAGPALSRANPLLRGRRKALNDRLVFQFHPVCQHSVGVFHAQALGCREQLDGHAIPQPLRISDCTFSSVFLPAPWVSLSALVSRMCIGMLLALAQSSIILSKSVIG